MVEGRLVLETCSGSCSIVYDWNLQFPPAERLWLRFARDKVCFGGSGQGPSENASVPRRVKLNASENPDLVRLLRMSDAALCHQLFWWDLKDTQAVLDMLSKIWAGRSLLMVAGTGRLLGGGAARRCRERTGSEQRECGVECLCYHTGVRQRMELARGWKRDAFLLPTCMRAFWREAGDG